MKNDRRDRERLHIGIVGAGDIGRVVGWEFETHPRATVAAIADLNERPRQETGDLLSVPEDARHSNYTAMLEQEAGLDGVLISTPHTLHYEQVCAALERDLHVLCAKPLTTDLERALDLTERDQQSDSVLAVDYERHLNPAFKRARERWQTGPKPTHFTAEVTQNWIDPTRGTWRTDPELSGGGMAYDTGSHIIDAVLWMTGLTPTHVRADMVFDDADERVDKRVTLTIHFENGAVGTVTLFGDAPAVREHIHVWDDDGAVYLEGREWEHRSLTIIDEDSTAHTPYIDHRYSEQTKADAFVTSILDNEKPPATPRDALRATAVTEAAYESARTGDCIPVQLP